MLFFKPKKNSAEILPPPPPFPKLAPEEEIKKQLPDVELEIGPDDMGDDDQLDKINGEIGIMEEATPQKTPKIIKIPKKTIPKKFTRVSNLKVKTKKSKQTKTPQKIKNKKKSKIQKSVKSRIPSKIRQIQNPKIITDFEHDDFGEIESAISGAKTEMPEEYEQPLTYQQAPWKYASDETSQIHNMISEARNSLGNFDLQNAKKMYLEILKAYNTLNPKQQSKVYQEIKDLYVDRKNAEGIKY